MKKQSPTSERPLISVIDASLDQFRDKGYFQHKIDEVNKILESSGSAKENTLSTHITASSKKTPRWKKLESAFVNLQQSKDLAIHTNIDKVIAYIYFELSPKKNQSTTIKKKPISKRKVTQ